MLSILYVHPTRQNNQRTVEKDMWCRIAVAVGKYVVRAAVYVEVA